MSFLVKCGCGQSLQTLPEHRGKRVRCPKCRATLQVPPPVPPPVPAEEYLEPILEEEDEGGVFQFEKVCQCPKCKHEWPEHTVLCINCGYHFKTGKQLKTEYDMRDRTLTVAGALPGNSTRFTLRRDAKGRRLLVRESWLLGVASGMLTLHLADFDAVVTDYTTDVELNPDAGPFSEELYYLELQGSHQRTVKLWHGSSEEKMHTIVDLLKSTGLRVKRK